MGSSVGHGPQCRIPRPGANWPRVRPPRNEHQSFMDEMGQATDAAGSGDRIMEPRSDNPFMNLS
eukprot:272733-Pyramimonas_sp.AAC.1